MAPDSFGDFVDQVSLIDHHVHGAFRVDGSEARFQNALNEANNEPLVRPAEAYESQLGFAVRRWCAGLLDLPPHVEPAQYWRRRSELGEHEVGRRMTRAAGVSDWLVDTGFTPTDCLGPDDMAAISGGNAYEIVRLEAVAESLMADIPNPADYADAFGRRLHERARSAERRSCCCTATRSNGRPDTWPKRSRTCTWMWDWR
ncbi:hypothetical protein [Specibacter cremeus]|uniref:hypothetical protein n=1 Tax=Specibacter cremeus TaxID=1629051 RepID=UPI001F0C09A1|nr:hypothetical protein [Specibacter cremeus]